MGINGTVAGPHEGIDAVRAHIRALPGCARLYWKESAVTEQPFRRLKVRLKAEIVPLGVPGVDPNARVGTYVAPADWNAVVDDPGTVVVDARNDYEVAIGSFKGAIDPGTASFRAFPGWWAQNRDSGVSGSVLSNSSPFARWPIASTLAERWSARCPARCQ